MERHPHYIQWWNEQVNLIRQTGGLAALPLAEIQEEQPMFEKVVKFPPCRKRRTPDYAATPPLQYRQRSFIELSQPVERDDG